MRAEGVIINAAGPSAAKCQWGPAKPGMAIGLCIEPHRCQVPENMR